MTLEKVLAEIQVRSPEHLRLDYVDTQLLCLAVRRLLHNIIAMFFYTSSWEEFKHAELIYILQGLNQVKLRRTWSD